MVKLPSLKDQAKLTSFYSSVPIDYYTALEEFADQAFNNVKLNWQASKL
jgi:hypothetical protein